MTEREAVAATFGASVALQGAIATMREVAESDKGSSPARDVLAEMSVRYEERLLEVLQLFYDEALKTKLEEILS